MLQRRLIASRRISSLNVGNSFLRPNWHSDCGYPHRARGRHPNSVRNPGDAAMRPAKFLSLAAMIPFIASFALVTSSGCSTKEKVIDVETPGGQVEVNRDRKTGEVDVEATDNK
jgi:hypothetical protein